MPGITEVLSDASCPFLRMLASSYSEPLTASNFFLDHYPRLSGWLNRFAHTQQLARRSTDPSHVGEVISLAENIISEARVVTRVGATEDLPKSEFFPSAFSFHNSLAESSDPSYSSVAEQLRVHLDYAQPRLPQPFMPSSSLTQHEIAVFCDCSLNYIRIIVDQIFNTYQWTTPDPRIVSDFFDPTTISSLITPWAANVLEHVKALEGWCSPQKAALLYSLARQYKPQTAVEIGIYGGRSIVPIAAALKDNGIGTVFGIETWSGSAATSYRTSIANDFWWMNIDFSMIKGAFLSFVVEHSLHDTIKIIEASSDQCAPLFDRIDFLHIDGGHSTFGAAKDVVDYVSRVPSGGIIVYDDINWPSTAAGLDILRDSCQLLHVVPAFGSETEPGCAAFIKI